MKSPAKSRNWGLIAVRILALAAVIGITIFIFSIRDQAEQLARYGIPGIFLLSVLSNATLILPAPGIAITFAAGAVFNPFFVALAAGAGSALGELTGYVAGFSGRAVIEDGALYRKLESWTSRYGNWTILVLAFIPNPLFDVAGVAAGALRMPLATFLFWTWIGKTIKMLIFALAGSESIDFFFPLEGG